MAEYHKPVPVPTGESQPYWAGCKRHELLLQRCRACGHIQFYPRAVCTGCLSQDLDWTKASGRGSVYSYSVVYRAPSKVFAADAPYTTAIIELEEGVRMMSNVVGCPPEEVRIGMPVEVIFEDVSEEIALPKFRPR